MKDQAQKIALAILAGLLILSVLVGLPTGPAEAAPGLAPTPVANLAPSDNSLYVIFSSGSLSITADAGTSAQQLPGYEYMDISYTSDQTTVGATGANTTTLTVQYSNDNSNWDNGVDLVASNATDVTDITRVPLFGRYVRIYQNVTNTNPVTFTILAVAK